MNGLEDTSIPEWWPPSTRGTKRRDAPQPNSEGSKPRAGHLMSTWLFRSGPGFCCLPKTPPRSPGSDEPRWGLALADHVPWGPPALAVPPGEGRVGVCLPQSGPRPGQQGQRVEGKMSVSRIMKHPLNGLAWGAPGYTKEEVTPVAAPKRPKDGGHGEQQK